MGVLVLDLYRNPNVGIYSKGNDSFMFVPEGIPQGKTTKLKTHLKVEVISVTIGDSRVIGALMAANGKGVLVSRMTTDEEISIIMKATKLPTERFPSNFTATGNLVASNDFGAVVSPLLSTREIKMVSDVLDVPVERVGIASYVQTGALVAPTNKGAVIHPAASSREIKMVKEVLKVDVEPCTINGGVPFVASGLVANSNGMMVGSVTTGPELAILSRVFKF